VRRIEIDDTGGRARETGPALTWVKTRTSRAVRREAGVSSAQPLVPANASLRKARAPSGSDGTENAGEFSLDDRVAPVSSGAVTAVRSETRSGGPLTVVNGAVNGDALNTSRRKAVNL